MVLIPRRSKYRKQFRGTMPGKAYRGSEIAFGDFGLQAMSRGWVTSRQIEAARRAITHYTQRGGRVWIRIFPDKPVSDKPAEVRMGGGKGETADYVAVVKPGRIMFEMGGVLQNIAEEALRRAAAKLAVKTKIISKFSEAD